MSSSCYCNLTNLFEQIWIAQPWLLRSREICGTPHLRRAQVRCALRLQSQDFRLYGHKGMNSRFRQFCPQVITQKIVFGFVKCFAKSLGFDFQGKPGMITTSNVITLRTSFATHLHLRAVQVLAFFGSSHPPCSN
jgi:hypothetical protein